jgi:hypothetical protein
MWLSRVVRYSCLIVLLSIGVMAACSSRKGGRAASDAGGSAGGGGGSVDTANPPVDGPATPSGGAGGSSIEVPASSGGSSAIPNGGSGAGGVSGGSGGLAHDEGGPLSSGGTSPLGGTTQELCGSLGTSTAGRGCGAAGSGGASQSTSNSQGGTGAAGSGGSGGAGKGGSGGQASPDASVQADSGTVPPAIADGLRGLLPDGQCKSQGQILTVSVDNTTLTGRTWVPSIQRLPRHIVSHSSTQHTSTPFAFEVSFKAQGSGIWNASEIDANLVFGDAPYLSCDAKTTTGALRITANLPATGGATEICGVYDLTRTDATGAHSVHIICSFDGTVTAAVPGAI